MKINKFLLLKGRKKWFVHFTYWNICLGGRLSSLYLRRDILRLGWKKLPFFLNSCPFGLSQGIAYFVGVARGCGWQNFAVFINLGTLYCIGTPISIILGFIHKLYARVSANFTHTHMNMINQLWLSFGWSIDQLSSFSCCIFLKGLWLGLISGLSCHAVGFFVAYTTLKMDSTEGVSPKSHCSSIRTTNPLSNLV